MLVYNLFNWSHYFYINCQNFVSWQFVQLKRLYVFKHKLSVCSINNVLLNVVCLTNLFNQLKSKYCTPLLPATTGSYTWHRKWVYQSVWSGLIIEVIIAISEICQWSWEWRKINQIYRKLSIAILQRINNLLAMHYFSI